MGDPVSRTMPAPPHPRPRVLELFSGIGGFRWALQRAVPRLPLDIVAVDVNLAANRTYRHSFGDPPLPVSIEHWATPQRLDALGAHVWLLAPPCQPHTRTTSSRQRDCDDPRSAALTALQTALATMQRPPGYLLLENVPGFEASSAGQQWRGALQRRGYRVTEVLACPTQLGHPSRRRRYFCLARHPAAAPLAELCGAPSAVEEAPPPAASPAVGAGQLLGRAKALIEGTDAPGGAPHPAPQRLAGYLEQCEWGPGDEAGRLAELVLPSHTLDRYWRVLDFVTPASQACNCFTKGYMRNPGSSGSVLLTERMAEAWCSSSSADGRGRLRLDATAAGRTAARMQVPLAPRWFSPREIASLHGFPAAPRFGFADGVTLQQQCALLGNSLSVDIVAPLIAHLLLANTSHTTHTESPPL